MPLDRRTTFGEDAERYDRARPGYPEALFDDLVRLTGLRSEARVLEIGCGTGQATIPLARRGFGVRAVELSASLAEVARRNLRLYANVTVEVGAFESLDLPQELFDLVLAASSLHWVDPEVRYRKAAEMLRAGGWLAVVHTHHVAGGSGRFFEESQACYQRFFPESAPDFHLPRADEVRSVSAEIGASGAFAPSVSRTYPWERSYSTEEYLDLLRTYSDHRSLGPARREELLACLGDLIARQFDGKVVKAHLTELTVARKVDLRSGASG